MENRLLEQEIQNKGNDHLTRVRGSAFFKDGLRSRIGDGFVQETGWHLAHLHEQRQGLSVHSNDPPIADDCAHDVSQERSD